VSTYKKEFGTAVQNNAGDYTGAVQGQLWYNSTAGSFQFRSVTTAGAWATGGSLNTARYALASAKLGTQTAALAFGGTDSPATTGATESYNGASWTTLSATLNTSRDTLGGLGTQTAAIAVGGNVGIPTYVATAVTESYNGTSWTEVSDLNQGRFQIGATGTSTLGLVFGGVYEPSPPTTIVTAQTESWNETSWTAVNDLNTARYGIGGAGTQTAALAFGGTPPVTNLTERWNGTCWTEVADLNTVRTSTTGAGHTDTEAMSMGGYVASPSALTELWNGTSWSEDTDLNTATRYLAGAGTTASALAFGGTIPPFTAATEEWTGAGAPVTETITTS
jgi:hypothetical protein